MLEEYRKMHYLSPIRQDIPRRLFQGLTEVFVSQRHPNPGNRAFQVLLEKEFPIIDQVLESILSELIGNLSKNDINSIVESAVKNCLDDGYKRNFTT